MQTLRGSQNNLQIHGQIMKMKKNKKTNARYFRDPNIKRLFVSFLLPLSI